MTNACTANITTSTYRHKSKPNIHYTILMFTISPAWVVPLSCVFILTTGTCKAQHFCYTLSNKVKLVKGGLGGGSRIGWKIISPNVFDMERNIVWSRLVWVALRRICLNGAVCFLKCVWATLMEGALGPEWVCWQLLLRATRNDQTPGLDDPKMQSSIGRNDGKMEDLRNRLFCCCCRYIFIAD